MPRYLIILLIPAMVFGISYIANTPSSSNTVKQAANKSMPVATIGDVFSRL